MNFDEVISNAKRNENEMYFKKFSSESWFRVNRRDCSRLHLTCRNDKKCEFSIRCVKITSAKNVKVSERMETHTCSFKEFKKKTLQHGFAINNGFARSSESKDTTTSDQVIIQTSTTTSISDDDFIWSGVANEVSGSTLSGSDLPMGTTTQSDQVIIQTSTTTSTSDDDFIWSDVDNEVSGSTLSVIADAGSDLSMGTTTQSDQVIIQTSTTTSTSDDDFIWSGDILPADNVHCSPAELGLLEMIAELKKREEDQQKTKNELLETSEKAMHKYVDIIMAVCDDYVCSSDKAKVFKSLSTIVANQFGSSYVKDLFLSYSSANERNQLIFDLQLLRSFHFPEKYSTSNAIQLTLPVTNKRKLCNFFDDDFEEVIYVDK